MSGIKVHEDGRKAYKLKESGQYTLVEGNHLYVDEFIINKNTIVIVSLDKLTLLR